MTGTIQRGLLMRRRPVLTRQGAGSAPVRLPAFSDETAMLLRSRLAAAALIMTLVMSAAFVGNAIVGLWGLWWLRAGVLLLLLVCHIVLRSDRPFSLSWLHGFELLIFGMLGMQLMCMLSTQLEGYAETREAASGLSFRAAMVSAWTALMYSYSILMPNTWRRAALVLVPMACVPYLVLLATARWNPGVEWLLQQDESKFALPLPFVAAAIGTLGAHVVNAMRREAFQSRQFGQYLLHEHLGAGGVGDVYKAEHTLLKRPCAMKLIKADSETNETAIARFEKEVKATAKLTHWNTVEIYDYGRTSDGTFYYVMELLPGLNLEDLVKQHGPLAPARVVSLLRQVCGALQEAHAAGLIHRDIKPANIFATQRGGVYDVAKLLDFGLVKEGVELTDGAETRHGLFSGTPLFMSPEQALSYEDVDGRADIYSLGVVAYYLLTGQTPFVGQDDTEILVAHAQRKASPPSEVNPEVPPDLDEIVLKCLAKRPAHRFDTAACLAAALDGCSLAGQWGPAEAEQWWQAIASGLVTDHAVADTDGGDATILCVQGPSI